MNDARVKRLQYLLITELLKKGSVQLLLPDGITLDIGITQEDKFGKLRKTDDYCYVVATRDGSSIMMDKYNLGLQYEPEDNTIIYENESVDKDGTVIRSLDIV